MPGIIDWNELWKATHTRGFIHHDEDLAAHWDRRADEFNKRVMKHREKAERQVAQLGCSLMRPYWTWEPALGGWPSPWPKLPGV